MFNTHKDQQVCKKKSIMETINTIVLMFACLCVKCGYPLTIEELSPLLETLKAGIRAEVLSEIKSITTELRSNVAVTGEIVSLVQNQEEVIKGLAKEFNETKLLLKSNEDHTKAIELKQKEIKRTIEADIKHLNETQVDAAELETTIIGLEKYHDEVKAAFGNQSNTIKLTQQEIKDTVEAQTIELNDLKQGFKGVVKELNGTQVDVAELEATINGLEVAIGNHSNQFNELPNTIELTQQEIKDTIGGQTIELNDLKEEFKGVVKELNETQVDVAELETTIIGLEVAIVNHSNQFNEMPSELELDLVTIFDKIMFASCRILLLFCRSIQCPCNVLLPLDCSCNFPLRS